MRKISIAPMMECTDPHFRRLLRCISKKVYLYTEMITTAAILHGDLTRLLPFNSEEHPVALQLGGSDPKSLAQCAKIAETWQYDEVNLNVGCPSDRVQAGRIGACLMKESELVAECVAAMQSVTDLPITVKTRLGVDDQDSYEFLCQFIETVSKSGCKTFIIHARKAWLKGLSPKQNREIPPLNYTRVYRIKQDFPGLEIIINGGIKNLQEARNHFAHVDGVMIGREAYSNPYCLAEVDHLFYGEKPALRTREEVLNDYLPYVREQVAKGVPLRLFVRHLMGLYQGEKGAKEWRREGCERILKSATDAETFLGG